MRSQHAQVDYGGRGAEQDEDKPLSPGATTATLVSWKTPGMLPGQVMVHLH